MQILILCFVGFWISCYRVDSLGITLNPTSATLAEDNTAEVLLSDITYSGVTAGDTVSCSVTSASPASTDYFSKVNTATSNYAVYCQAVPTSLSYAAVQAYTLTIQCNENINTGNTATANLALTIQQNQAPVIQNLPGSTSISSLGTSSGQHVFNVTVTDSESDQLYYGISCDPSGCPFQIQESGHIIATSDLTGTAVTSYDVSVSVNDSRSTDGPKVLTVSITDINSVPTFNNPLTSPVSVAENVALSYSIYDLNVDDSNAGDTHTFTATYSPSTGINYFSVDSSTGLISTSSSNSINYEALSTSERTTVITVTVSDGQSTATTTVTILVTDVNEAPAFSKTSYVLSADESVSGTAVGQPYFDVTDPEGNGLAYTLSCVEFTYNPTTGVVSFATNYDLDVSGTATSVTCNVGVSDGTLSDTATLTINVNNINDNTPTLDQPAYTYVINHDTAVGTTIGTITATDNDASPYGTVSFFIDQSSLGNEYLEISSAGVVTVKNTLTKYGTGETLSLTVTATDSGGLSVSAPVTVVVPATTTAASTTTTEAAKTFFDDARNIAWFTATMVTIIGVTAVAGYVCFKKYTPRKIPEKKPKQLKKRIGDKPEYPGDPWDPWKIWEHTHSTT